MSGKTTIKQAGPADLESIIPLILGQFSEHSIEPWRERLEAAVREVLAGGDKGRILLAESDGRAVGFAYVSFTWSLEHGGSSAWLEELYVQPMMRNQHIGQQLLAEVLNLAARLNLRAVDLEVDENHARAGNMYRRAGFTSLPRSRWVRLVKNDRHP